MESKSFERYLKDETLIEKIKKEELFSRKLLNDIKSGEVYPAIRIGNKIEFYHFDNCLFYYDAEKGFSTHKEYCTIADVKGSYISKDETECIKLKSFYDAYDEIKKRCKKYCGLESLGTKELCKYNSLFSNKDKIILDVEIGFSKTPPESQIEKQKDAENENLIFPEKPQKATTATDRIDMLLFDTKSKKLYFCENKHLSNKEIKLNQNGEATVVEQINRYRKYIKDNKVEILESYKKYVKQLNCLLGTKLPMPEDICLDCALLIYGFDEIIKNGLNLSKEVGSENKHFSYLQANNIKHMFIGTPNKDTTVREIIRILEGSKGAKCK